MRSISLCIFILLVWMNLFSVSAEEFKSPPMVLVPKGRFKMGNDEFKNAKPVHSVTLTNDFYISKYEITNQEYADMLNYALNRGYLDKNYLSGDKIQARGISKSPQKYLDVSDEDSQIIFKDGKFEVLAGKENFPVLELTWYGAAFYCNMLSEREGLTPLYNLDDWSCQVYGKTGYRLPTEAEWEYAARYNDARRYPWGNQDPDASYANVNSYNNGPVFVGSYSPKGDSKLGISDMAGNVAEWCNDWYNDYSAGEQIDPIGPGPSLYVYLPFFKQFQPLRVVRGGCYLYDPNFRKGMGPPFEVNFVTDKSSFDNGYRGFDYRNMSRAMTGFRIVKTIATAKTKSVWSAPEN
ncbi:MAG: formylglycine-generating enzyme family protein [Candidatus Omnitrophica bacterium]|nr:formylglycine-generating enzyme family protein [Candidatus Omnitrophota bacterium]